MSSKSHSAGSRGAPRQTLRQAGRDGRGTDPVPVRHRPRTESDGTAKRFVTD